MIHINHKTYKHGRRAYSFSPYRLLWNNDRYYVVGYSDSHGKVITFRVDRIATPALSDTPAEPPAADFDISLYARSVFSMYDGPMCDVVLRCENGCMKTIIDRFGETVKTTVLDSNHFAAFVHISASPTFYGWLFSFAGKITITGPQEIKDEYMKMVRSCLLE